MTKDISSSDLNLTQIERSIQWAGEFNMNTDEGYMIVNKGKVYNDVGRLLEVESIIYYNDKGQVVNKKYNIVGHAMGLSDYYLFIYKIGILSRI